MKKIVSLEAIKPMLKDGMTVMIGGFLGNGTPEVLIDLIISMKLKNLTIIGNDTSFVSHGIGKLVVNNCCKKVIVSHIGTNPETGKKMSEGSMEVELSPQGTLAERVRAGGCGLGGVLTQTGLGTMVEEGKEKIKVDDQEYLLEKPLRADIAFVGGSVVDGFGNTIYKGTSRNFNPLIAMAADMVIVGAKEIVETGSLNPNDIITPGVLVDYIVKDGE